MNFESDDSDFFDSRRKGKQSKKMKNNDEYGRSFNNNRKKNKPSRGKDRYDDY